MQPQKKDWLLISGIVIVVLIIMMPRILSAQFGLLDDGVLLLSAQYAQKDFYSIFYQFQGAGRFLPTATFLRLVTFSIAGFNPQIWYIVSTVILIIICIQLSYIVSKSDSGRSGQIFSLLFFLASPSLVENFYTLSKSEVPMLLFISTGIVLAINFSLSESTFGRIFSALACFFSLLFAFGAKETAIVLPILFLCWLLVSRILTKKSTETTNLLFNDALLLFLGSTLSGIIYWSVRSVIIGNSSTGLYADGYQILNIDKLLTNFVSLLGWIIRDFPYLVLSFAAVLLLPALRETKFLANILRWGLWMGAMGAVLLPWGYTSYYLLLFSFGSAIFNGMIIAKIYELLRHQFLKNTTKQTSHSHQEPMNGVISPLIFFVASLLLFLPSGINAIAFASEQLILDRANWRLVESITKLPSKSRLYINLPEQVEYTFEIQLFVNKILNRPDISVLPYRPPIYHQPDESSYLANLVFQGQILPSVRALHGPTVTAWGLCLQDADLNPNKTHFSTRISRPILDVGLHRLLSFLKVGDMVGQSDRGILTISMLSYGWDVWELAPNYELPARPGVYQDGIFTWQTTSREYRSIVFGEGDETPLAGDINGDGFTDLVLYDEDTGKWITDINLDGTIDKIFSIPNIKDHYIPFLGDWDGDGSDTPGLFVPSKTEWVLYDQNEVAVANYFLGEESDIPIIGDWDRDEIDEIGIYRPKTGYTMLVTSQEELNSNPFFFDTPAATPVAAKWEGTNRDTIAFVQNDLWTLRSFNIDCLQSNPSSSFQFETTGIPLAGNWKE